MSQTHESRGQQQAPEAEPTTEMSTEMGSDVTAGAGTSEQQSSREAQTSVLPLSPHGPAGAADRESPDGPARSMGKDGARQAPQGPGAPLGGPDPQAQDGVWSARTVAGAGTTEPQGMSPATLVWGTILLLVGVLLVVIGLGVRVDLVTTGIVILAAVGVALLVMALLPRRGSRS